MCYYPTSLFIYLHCVRMPSQHFYSKIAVSLRRQLAYMLLYINTFLLSRRFAESSPNVLW